MNNILKAWNAGFVRRWHTNPFLSRTDDFNAGHQNRCTVLLLLFWPNASRDSIIDTLTHDQGEIDAGDMARPAKHQYPEINNILKSVEQDSIKEQGFLSNPKPFEIKRRQFVDLLDSYLWMLRNEPKMRNRPEWIEQRGLLDTWANELEIKDSFLDFCIAAQEYYVGK